MARPIDEKIISMKLENENFESNARQSLSTFQKLKSAFTGVKGANLDDAAHGMSKLGKAVKGIGLDKVGSALDTVSQKFSTLGVIGTTALVNLTNRAINAGLALTKSLTIAPIMDGFKEYETKMGSIQTILANTAKDGTNLNQVNAVLNDLNTYADKTIYNFAEMTKNIGTFTAAGIKLEPAKQSIKGIANLAAMSGSTSQQASTAMYQLSQALAAGTLKLQDWNSVVNAGMGGRLFQDSLKETARAHGIAVDEMIAKNGSFRESLQEGWITSEVLTETLQKFTGELSDAQLKQMGYSDEQVKQIQKTAKMAVEAATKVRTFTQLMDTAKEAVGSGFAMAWQYLIGDFEQATDRLTRVSDAFGELTNNAMAPFLDKLEFLNKSGYIDVMWETFFDIASSIGKVLSSIGSAFKEIFPPSTGAQWAQVIMKFKTFATHLRPTKEGLQNLKDTFKGLFSVLKLGVNAIKTVGSFLLKLIPGNLSGDILSITAKFGRFLTKITNSGTRLSGLKTILDHVAEGFHKFYDAVSNSIRSFTGFEKGASVISKVLEKIGNVLTRVWQGIQNTLSKIDLSDIANASFITTLFLVIKKVTGLIDELKDKFGGLFDNIGNIIGEDSIFAKLGDTLEAFQSQVKSKIIMQIAVALGIFAASLLILSGINMASLAKGLTALGLGLGEMVLATKALSMINKGGGLRQALANIPTMLAIASSLVLLATSLRILNGMDTGKLAPAVIAMGAVMGELVVVSKLMSTVNLKGVKTTALIGMALAMLILVKTLEPLTGYNVPQLVKSISAMGAMMLELALFAKMASGTKLGPGAALGVLGVAASLLIMAQAVEKIKDIDTGSLIKGLSTIAVLLGEIAVFSKVTAGGKMVASGAGLLALATGLTLMMVPLQTLSTMSLGELVKSLGSLAVVIGEIAIASKLIGGQGLIAGASITAMAAGIALLAPALLMLSTISWGGIAKGLIAIAGAFAVLGAAGVLLAPVAPAMLAVAAALGILGAALLAAGAGMSLAVGALQIVAEAPAKLVQALRTFVQEAILVFTESVPQLAEALVLMITSTLQSVSAHLPELIKVLVDIVCKIIDGVAESMPRIAESVSKLINSIFDSAKIVLSNVPIDKLKDAVLAVGVIAVVANLAAALAPSLPAALAGIASAGVLMVAIGGVLAAVGGLYNIPGVADFVNRGGDFLMAIGKAIGKFVGGLVGGVLEGATASLPNVGKNLSDFMNNAKGFIDGANSIQPGSMEGVGALTSAMLKLTAANLLNSISNFLNIFGGGNSMANFGTQLTAFGTAMKNYGQQVSGVDTAAITASVEAADGLAQVAKKLPNMGGLVSFFTGDNGMAKFGSELAKFGGALKRYSTAVVGIDIGAINNSVAATKGIVQLSNSLGNSGGLISLFTGDNSLAKLGSQLVAYGRKLSSYSSAIQNVDVGKITSVSTASKSLSTMASNLGTGANLPTFAVNIVKLGTGLNTFSVKVATFNSGNMASAMTSIKNLINELNKLGNIPVGKINALGTAVKQVGTNAIRDLKNSFTSGQSSVSAAVGNLLTNMANQAKSKGTNLLSSAANAMMNKFVSSINSQVGAVRSAANQMANAMRQPLSQVNLYQYGVNAGAGFARGLSSQYNNVYNAAARLANSASNAVRRNLRIHSPSRVMMELADYTVQGFVNPIADGESSAFKAASGLAKGALDGVKGLANQFGSIVDSEFAYSPTITPVLDWSQMGGDKQLPGVFGSVSTNYIPGATSLASIAVTGGVGGTTTTTGGVVNHYNVNNKGLLDGAVFQVREESDIRKIAKQINRLENEELYRKGIVL